MSHKRKFLTINEKKNLLNLYEKSNSSKLAFAKEHNIPRTTLNNILAAKVQILKDTCVNGKSRKNLRTTKFEEIEEVLIRWLRQVRAKNMPISGTVLQEKAMQISRELHIDDFKASNGWIERFKERHYISFKKVCGEAAAVDPAVTKDWIETSFKDILSRYSESDIFNLDETALFYELLPDKTLAFQDETCSGGKLSKKRLTVLLGANMMGTEKLKPVVIGRSNKPRCFKTVKSLPVFYHANSKSWMSSTIWEKSIREYDKQFLLQRRKVVFVVDNCAAHVRLDNLRAIEVAYMPPNVTASLQPLDQGVIRNFKVNYKKLLIADLLATVGTNKIFEVSILDAILYIHKSWNNVASSTIANCFRHAGFIAVGNECSDLSDSDDTVIYECEEDSFDSVFQELQHKGFCTIDVNAYLSIDDNVEICSNATIPELAAEVLEDKDVVQITDDDSDDDNSGIVPPPSKVAALNGLDTVKRYLVSCESVTDNDFQLLLNLERKIIASDNYQQATLYRYFTKDK